MIIRVHESANGPDRFFLDAPSGFKDARVGHNLPCDPSKPPFEPLDPVDPIKTIGKTLYEALCVHPAIAKALTALLGPGARQPIAIFAESTNADRLPWEALYDAEKQFLALDGWPIVRLRESGVQKIVLDYVLQPPLRLLCVISAAGASDAQRAPGAEEWKALLTEVRTVSEDPAALPLDLRVLVGEASLKALIDEDAKTPPAGVSIACEFITGKDKIITTIDRFAPHLVHFFCHGSIDGEPHLRIGTREDWVAQQEGGVSVDASDLGPPDEASNAMPRIWMVTLNCCESAAHATDARILAARLVQGGVPAVLGMRERLDTQSAHLLTSRYYRAILKGLAALPEGELQELEWGRLLHSARRNLATENGIVQQEACKVREWTIPALYVRLQPFNVQRMPILSPAQLALAREREDIRRQAVQVRLLDLPETTKQGILAEFQARLDAIEAKLRD